MDRHCGWKYMQTLIDEKNASVAGVQIGKEIMVRNETRTIVRCHIILC